MMRRIVSLALLLVVCAALAGLALRPTLIDRVARGKAAAVAERLGVELHIGSVHPDGWTGGRVAEIRLGPAAAPLLTVRSARAQLTWGQLLAGPRRPKAVDVEGVVLHVRGDGTLRGALEALRDALPRPPADRAGSGEGAGAGGARPTVRATDVRVVDHGGALAAAEGRFAFEGGRLTGGIVFTRPDLGRCDVELDRRAGKVTCDRPFEAPLPAGLRVGARAIELQLQPQRVVRVGEVRVAAGKAGGRLAAIVGGLAADVTVTLERDAEGHYPVTARLRLPGGAGIEAEGRGNQQRATISAEVSNFDLAKVHDTVGGSLSGSLDVRIDRETRTAVIEGKADLTDFKVAHPALAEDPIGPMTLSASGRIDASALAEGPLDRGRIALTAGQITVGKARLALEASVDTMGEAPVVEATAKVARIKAADLAASIPEGLFPHLQPMEGKGRFSFESALRIDFARLKDTKLTAKADVARLKLTKLSPEVNFDGLRSTFTTHFEMPDGTVIERTTGPDSARWTALADIPPLMPLAVITQEDGGFYRHGGISMFHLRGSLVRNLERGRFARGGSTLSMQLARNLFLHRKKTLARKLEELVLTWQLEERFSKEELITLYLNVVEFGPEVFGIADAAAHYFDKEPADLDPVEMVFLARLLPSPRRWGKQKDKGKPDGWYVKRMNRLLDLLADRGHLEPRLRAACRPAALWQGDTMDPSVFPPPLPDGRVVPPPWSPRPKPEWFGDPSGVDPLAPAPPTGRPLPPVPEDNQPAEIWE